MAMDTFMVHAGIYATVDAAKTADRVDQKPLSADVDEIKSDATSET